MKTSLSIMGSLAISAVAFFAGAMTAASRNWGQAVVTVKVVNTSDQVVNNFAILFGTCRYHGSIEGGILSPGSSAEIRYLVCGEGGQTIRAQFKDGRVVVGGEAYVESGYRITTKISNDAVTADGGFLARY